MYRYMLWGADLISDVPVDLDDDKFKRKLIDLKVKIDTHGVVTIKFTISNGIVKAYPFDTPSLRRSLRLAGLPVVDYYEDVLEGAGVK